MLVLLVFLVLGLLGFGVLDTALAVSIGSGFSTLQSGSRRPSSPNSAPATAPPMLCRGNAREAKRHYESRREHQQTFHISSISFKSITTFFDFLSY
jgi:hypothetical protein